MEFAVPEDTVPNEYPLIANGVESGIEALGALTIVPPDEDDDDEDNWWGNLPERSDLERHPEDAPEGSNSHLTTERTPLVDANGDRVGYLEEGSFLAIIDSDANWPAAQIATADGEEIWVEDYDQYVEIISFDLILDREEYHPGDEVAATGEHWAPEEDVVFELEVCSLHSGSRIGGAAAAPDSSAQPCMIDYPSDSICFFTVVA